MFIVWLLTGNKQKRVAFLMFGKASDWNSLEKVRFMGPLPNASPPQTRGDNITTVRNQGHCYCWAFKAGTLKDKTSSHEPWADYPVKGSWIDDLWTKHKLDHDTYLDYAARVRDGYVKAPRQDGRIKLGAGSRT